MVLKHQKKNLMPVILQGNKVIYALNEFHEKNGRFPKKLAELAPEYIQAIPIIESEFFEPFVKYDLFEQGANSIYRLLIIPKKQNIALISQEINWVIYMSDAKFFPNEEFVIHTRLSEWFCVTKYRNN